MHIWPTEEVCAGIYTLLCMFRPVIKHYFQERITNVKNVTENPNVELLKNHLQRLHEPHHPISNTRIIFQMKVLVKLFLLFEMYLV